MKILIKDVLLDGNIRDIFINNGTIEEIGVNCSRVADKIINGKNKAALPSFINGHTHAAMTLFRGYADDMPLKSWLEEKIWPLEAKLTAEDVYWGAKLACLEMIKNGITVFNDMYWHWEATAQATCDMGIRGLVSAVFIDMFDPKKSEEQIEQNIKLFETSKKYQPSCYIYLRTSCNLYRLKTEPGVDAGLLGKRRHPHPYASCGNQSTKHDFSMEKYGLRPVEFLNSIDLLSERYIGCHGCMLD